MVFRESGLVFQAIGASVFFRPVSRQVTFAFGLLKGLVDLLLNTLEKLKGRSRAAESVALYMALAVAYCNCCLKPAL